MKIAVCDDNLVFLQEIKGILETKEGVANVETFSSPLELVIQVTNETDFDLIFMNLDWKSEEKTGFQWGEEIYQLRPNIPIIFVTGYNDCFAQQVLLAKANILGYMTKPVDVGILNKYLLKAIEQKTEPKYLVLSRQSGKISLSMKDIVHIESHNHKAIVFTEKEHYVVYEKLTDLQERLSKEFIRCHKSFLVNMGWIMTLEGKVLKLRNGREIPISRANASEVKKKFFEYVGTDI